MDSQIHKGRPGDRGCDGSGHHPCLIESSRVKGDPYLLTVSPRASRESIPGGRYHLHRVCAPGYLLLQISRKEDGPFSAQDRIPSPGTREYICCGTSGPIEPSHDSTRLYINCKGLDLSRAISQNALVKNGQRLIVREGYLPFSLCAGCPFILIDLISLLGQIRDPNRNSGPSVVSSLSKTRRASAYQDSSCDCHRQGDATAHRRNQHGSSPDYSRNLRTEGPPMW